MVILNLIPADVQIAMAKRRHLRWWAVSCSVAASLVLGALAVDWARQATMNDLNAQSLRLQSQLADVRTELEAVTADSNQVMLRVERANALRAKRAWSGLVALIGSCMPQGCWLSLLSTDPERPAGEAHRNVSNRGHTGKQEAQTAITIDSPRKFKIAGYAPQAAQPIVFVTNLKRAGVFSAVSLASSQTEPVLDGSYYRFELLCEW